MNKTVQFTAQAKDSSGNGLTGVTFTWTSSDESIAAVDASGLATGKAQGQVTIKSASGAISGTAALTVTGGTSQFAGTWILTERQTASNASSGCNGGTGNLNVEQAHGPFTVDSSGQFTIPPESGESGSVSGSISATGNVTITIIGGGDCAGVNGTATGTMSSPDFGSGTWSQGAGSGTWEMKRQAATADVTLTVTVTGSGGVSGTGFDTPATACHGPGPTICIHSYLAGTVVTLHGAAADNSPPSWGGACTGTTTNTCTLTMSANKSVTANFGTVVPPVQLLSAPTGLTATAGNSQVTLTWNALSGATSYTLYMASQSGVTKSNYTSLPNGMKHTGVTSPYTHTGLTNGTTYYFVVTATNAGGESAESAQVSATPQDTTPPTTPTGLTATAVSSSQINLTWTASTDNIGVTSYKVYRGGVQIATPTTTSYTDPGLTASTAYTYTVAACDAAGNCSAQSTAVSATTPAPPDITAPILTSTTPATNATAVPVASVITATFSEAMDAATINTTTFMLKVGVTSVVGTVSLSGNTATFTPSASLASATTYTATITTGAKDAAGNSIPTNFTWSFSTPATLTVTIAGSGSVSSSPAGITCGADCSEAYTSGTVVTLTATPAAGWAFNGWGGACTGTGVCSVTMTTDKSITATFGSPSAPTGLTATPVGTQVNVSWNPNPAGENVTSYVAYRAATPWTTWASTLPGAFKYTNLVCCSFAEGALMAGTTYYFSVAAVNSAGEGPQSAQVSATPFSAVSFGAATNFAVGITPFSVAIGDVNADGKPDLAVANTNSNTVSILLGTGTGSFGAATNFSAGTSPISVAIGDLNADGKPDLAVANIGSNNVSILLGTGTGSFGAATNFSAGTDPYSVAIGDLNADGKPDLAVANLNNNTISILLGTGAGSFGAATNFSVGSGPFSVAIGDVNADGKPDLAVANASSATVSILLGTGTGSFGAATNFSAGTDPYSVAIGDVNADGKPDLAVANASSANVSILLNTTPLPPSGSFGAATNFPAGSLPPSVAIGDLNSDGKPDLAVANASSNTVSVLLGTGPGAFGAATNFPVGTTPYSVAIGDLNVDGKPDLAVANRDSNNVSILLGTGTGSFGAATNFFVGTTPRSVAIGDLNADGKPDLAVANYGTTVSVFLGTGAGSFGAATNFSVGTGPESVAIGDVNADGKPDLAVANRDSNNVSVLLGTGTGSFGAATNYPVGTGPESVAIGDLNADGKPDLAVANWGSGNVSVLLNQ